MTLKQEASRLKKEFGEKAVKVCELIISCNKFPCIKERDLICNVVYWSEVRSELQKPVNDPFIDEVEEFHPILKKIYAMMRGLEPSIPYSELKVSHLPPPETFAMYPKVGKRSVTHYTDGYEKYRAVTND